MNYIDTGIDYKRIKPKHVNNYLQKCKDCRNINTFNNFRKEEKYYRQGAILKPRIVQKNDLIIVQSIAILLTRAFKFNNTVLPLLIVCNNLFALLSILFCLFLFEVPVVCIG